jgi:IMP dehydrogenase
MPTVSDLLALKGARVQTVGKDATVLQAAVLMNDHQIGALVVTEQERVAGMFTERDVLRRVVAEQRDPAQARVEQVMTRVVVCCRPQTSVDEARVVMKERRIRHLPVVDDAGRLLGLISLGDINAFDAASQERTIVLLHEYLYGRG